MTNLNTFFNKIRKKTIIPVSVILSLIVLLQLYFVFEVSIISNDECLWIPKKTESGELRYIFGNVKENGVAWNAEIRDGDTLLEINHVKINDAVVAQKELNKVEGGDSALYKIARGNEKFETKVEVKKLVNFGGLAFALFGGFWLLVSAIVLSVKPDGYTQIIFYRIGATLVLLSCFNFLFSNYNENPFDKYWTIRLISDLCYTFGSIFIGFLLIHFFWIFPRRLKIMDYKWTKKILYTTPTVIFILVMIFRIVFLYSRKMPANTILPKFEIVNLILIFIGIAVSLTSLFINYYNLKTKDERNTIFLILVGYSITAASFLYNFIVNSTLNPAMRFNSPEFFMPVILISILPLAFGYSIFKYSLMDISEVVKTTITYGLATLAVAGIYFLVIYLIGQTVSSAIGTDYQAIIAGAIFIIFAFVFQSTKDKFQETLTKRFYPEQFAYQKVLLKFSKEVPSITGFENILKITSNTFVDALKIKRFGIALRLKNDQRKFKVKNGFGLKEDFCFEVNIEAFAKFLLMKNDLELPVIIEENDFNNIFHEKAKELNENEIFTIIPLQVQSKIIGFLLFGLKHSGSKFAGQDLELLSAAAIQVAYALENARLYESEKEKLILERDLENAKQIQLSLLPKSFPKVKSLDLFGTMIPAMHVGGDYFDLVKISDTKLFVVIGDVSGKGMSASLYMSKLQTMFQLYSNKELSPKEILIKLNENIFQRIERNWFITSSIALIDTEKNQMTFARAGHTPLSLISNGKVQQLKPNGIGLGLESSEIFNKTIEEIDLPLHKDDLLAFYSDGITEAMNEESELFGTDRFHEILLKNSHNTTKFILDEILLNIENFRGNAIQNDDITIVLIKLV
ncbi:MAG: hypothetical protein Fur0015_00350 [Ignavibacteriales bacterium]